MRLTRPEFNRCMALYVDSYGGNMKNKTHLIDLWWERCSWLEENAFVAAMNELLGDPKKFGFNQVIRLAKEKEIDQDNRSAGFRRQDDMPPARGMPKWAPDSLRAEENFKLGRMTFEAMCDEIRSAQAHIWSSLWPGTQETLGQVWERRFVELGDRRHRGLYRDRPSTEARPPAASPSVPGPLPAGIHHVGEVAGMVLSGPGPTAQEAIAAIRVGAIKTAKRTPFAQGMPQIDFDSQMGLDATQIKETQGRAVSVPTTATETEEEIPW